MATHFPGRRVILISLCLVSAAILSSCNSSGKTPVQSTTPMATTVEPTATTSTYSVPLSCIETKMLSALKKTVPAATYVDPEWTPSKGTELAYVLNNSGIACSFGIQPASVGLTAMWVSNEKGLFESRVPKWLEEGYKKVDVIQLNEESAYFLRKPQSKTQEFTVWQLDLNIRGFWIQLSLSFGDTLESGLPFIQAAVDSLMSNTPKANVVGCYVAKLAKDRFVLDITEQNGGDIEAKIAYLNFEKDRSTGTFIGTYEAGILDGIYSFTSEGMDSRRELIFRQVKNGFISGFGPIEMVGEVEKLKRPLDLTWNSTFIYVPSSDCTFS